MISIILMVVLTALLMGNFVGMYMSNNNLAKLIESSQEEIRKQDKVLERQDDSLSLLNSNLLQTRLEGAQTIENQRTMFQYLDNAINATIDNTKAIENITNSLQLQTKGD